MPDTTQMNLDLPRQMDFSAPKDYTLVEQQKLLGDALVEGTTAAGDSKDGGKGSTDKDFAKLMPTWMLCVGGTYAKLQKDYDSNSPVGQFIRHLQALSTVEQAFTQAVGGASSFATLKYFLDHDTYFSSMKNDVGCEAREMRAGLDSFTPQNHSTADQVQQQEQSEFNIVSSQSQIAQDEGSKEQNTAQGMQTNGNSLFSDASQVGDFINQIGAASAA